MLRIAVQADRANKNRKTVFMGIEANEDVRSTGAVSQVAADVLGG